MQNNTNVQKFFNCKRVFLRYRKSSNRTAAALFQNLLERHAALLFYSNRAALCSTWFLNARAALSNRAACRSIRWCRSIRAFTVHKFIYMIGAEQVKMFDDDRHQIILLPSANCFKFKIL